MLQLIGRKKNAFAQPEEGLTLLEAALLHDVDWGYHCTRGTCARCRCLVQSGAEHLSPPNDAEKLRLEPEELKEGFRLGCQAKMMQKGEIRAVHRPYFG